MSSASSDFTAPPEDLDDADPNSPESDIAQARARLRQKASEVTLPNMVRSHPYEAIAIALALGVLTGAGPRRAAQIAKAVSANLPLILKFIR